MKDIKQIPYFSISEFHTVENNLVQAKLFKQTWINMRNVQYQPNHVTFTYSRLSVLLSTFENESVFSKKPL